MATSNLVVDNNFADDAEWRTYCQAIEAAILASGFLAVAADTGQLDLTSAVRPAIGLYTGYRIYEAVDALAVANPIKIKVEYGVGTATNRPKVQWSAAPTSNGAGTLVSPIWSPSNMPSATADGGGTARIIGSGIEEAMSWIHVQDVGFVNSQGGFFMISRLISVIDGEPQAGLRLAHLTSSQAGTILNATNFTDGAASWTAASMTMTDYYPNLTASIQSGGDINNTLLFQGSIYREAKTLTLPVLTGKAAELPYTDPDSSAFTLDIWGEAHTFVPLPQSAVSGSNQRVAMPWE